MFKFTSFKSYKTLFIATLIFSVTSAINLFGPLDIVLTALSNKVRSFEASGDIVVVSIDNFALEQGFTAPLPAEATSTMVENVIDAGARMVVVSEPVLATNQDNADTLNSLLERYPDRIFIAQPTESSNGRQPANKTRYITGLVGIHNEKLPKYWGGVSEVQYVIEHEGRRLISAESVLTGVQGRLGEKFTIDYAIDARSIPFVSYGGQNSNDLSEAVNGKDVVLGYETSASATPFPVPGQEGTYGLPTITALGAETIINGRTRHLSGLWSLLAAIIISWALLQCRSVKLQVLAMLASALGGFVSVVLLNSVSIIFPTAHAIFMVFVLGAIGITRVLKAKATEESAIHPDSGLPSVNALWRSDKEARPLVVASIARFEELMGLLSPSERKMLADRICSLATPSGEIWHGEDGRFYWFIREEQSDHLASHLESLALILRNGFSIGSLPVSLQTVFGVDLRFEAKMSDRILGANLSAKRATSMSKVWLAYEEGDRKEAAWSVTRLRELDLAIQAGQIRADLQPKVNLRTGSVTGAEALARWTHPIRGSISPDEFVKAAEDGGRIKELTIAVMHSALSSVRQAISDDPAFTVSVNISPSLLADPTLCGSISSLLALYQIDPANLILEVTESTAFAEDDVVNQCMHELVGMGIQLSIDDYGTGNSTLAYLRNIPAGELKIDQKFVSDIMTSGEDEALVQSTIQLAHELNMVVVAEGVEDSRTLEKLRQMGCDVGQGYLISRPLTPDHFAQYMANLQRPRAKINAR